MEASHAGYLVRRDVCHELQLSFFSRYCHRPGDLRPEAIAESEMGPETEHRHFDPRNCVQVIFDVRCERVNRAVEVDLVPNGEKAVEKPAVV